jgi:uncharacterized protein (DUF58 family)
VRVRPGRSLVTLAIAAVGMAAVGLFWPPMAWLLWALLLGGIAGLVADYRQLKRDLQSLKITRVLPGIAGRGMTFEDVLKIESSAVHPIRGESRDVLPPESEPRIWIENFELGAGGTASMACSLRIPMRGLHKFGPVWARLEGRFGFLDAQKSYVCEGQVKVMPECAASKDGLLADRRADQMIERKSAARRGGAGIEFESLREFREGDEPRRIDWRVSAKHRRLIVRKHVQEHHRDLVILVDSGRLMGSDTGLGTKLDRAIDSALMLCRVALERGDRCGIGVFDHRVEGFLPPISGGRALPSILESLYNVQTNWMETDFSAMFAHLQSRHPKRSMVVILSDLADADTTTRYRAAMSMLAKRHVVVFAALQTPLLRRQLEEPIEEFLDVSRKSVVLRLLREREKALHSLDRSGVHVLDVEPRDLTAPLINKYVSLREANVL